MDGLNCDKIHPFKVLQIHGLFVYATHFHLSSSAPH